jgi:CRP/FNR family transcriptional regulator, cyclic AMP receptor protein
MKGTEAIIRVIEDNGCPLYGLGDEFTLSDTRVLWLPPNKAACTTLVEDIAQVRTLCENVAPEEENGSENLFHCNGPTTNCAGSVGLRYLPRGPAAVGPSEVPDDDRQADIVRLLREFGVFQSLDAYNLRTLAGLLKLKKYSAGGTVIRRGEPGVKLYIIVSGKVAVVGGDGVIIAELGPGEVFGEMSLLSGNPAGATVSAVEETWLLYINGKDFRRILNRFPSLQMYFARLLARRLAQTTDAMSEEIASAMVGQLCEMPPAELFQTLHQNQKTGVLRINAADGPARFAFREGEMIDAQYGAHRGTAAFFRILTETEGRFKLSPELDEAERDLPELGDFMWLLMEGLNRIDEGLL